MATADLFRSRLQARYASGRYGGRVLVGYSGGKDSQATLALCCETFADVHAFVMELVPDLECVMGPVHAGLRRFPRVRLHRVQHWMTANMLRDGVFCLPPDRLSGIRRVKLGDIETKMRAESGCELIAYGYRRNDSNQRRGMLASCPDGLDELRGRCHFYPIADWKKQHVLSFLHGQRIPIPQAIAGKPSSGVDLQPDELRWIRKHFPLDYERILEVFPDADAVLFREEMRESARRKAVSA